MKEIFTILICTSLFAGELEVDGNLTVTEGVNASSFVGDGSGLTNLPSLGDMKPERIYNYTREEYSSFNFSVPSDKAWFILVSKDTRVDVDNVSLSDINKPIWLFPNQTLSIGSGVNSTTEFMIIIYEYPISGSGTDQGMDYVEP